MCGIYGMVSLSEAPLQHPDLLGRMGAALKHRGPDSSGAIRQSHAAIGAERLSIIDRRTVAGQPLRHPNKDLSLVCNGEIYNSTSLRSVFARYPYRTKSDLEPLLPLLKQHGASGLDLADGMFALACWWAKDRTLVLARDRAGEKPLFYMEYENEVWFASEIQALLIHPRCTRELDTLGLGEFLSLGYVREPHTIFSNVKKIPAGVSLTFRPEAGPKERALQGIGDVASRSQVHAKSGLRALLEDAVAKQLVADVPVGVLISGGLDSAVLAALAQRNLGSGLHTFTVSFRDPAYDEGRAARRMAEWLRTSHTEISVSGKELKEAFQLVCSSIAEPLADPALLPTYLLTRAARQQVGVALTGEGADELFGGYPTYLGHAAADGLRAIPSAWPTLRAVARTPSNSHRPNTVWYLAERFVRFGHLPWRDRHLAWMGSGLYQYLSPDLRAAVLDGLPLAAKSGDSVTNAMTMDYRTYLRDGLLAKIDRAAMLSSLETRAPYLDMGVTSFANSLPRRYHLHGLHTKALLKSVGSDLLPPWVINRRKRGFSVPIADLINSELRHDVDRLLAPERTSRQGVLQGIPIDELLVSHRSGRTNNARFLWPLIVLQSWLEHWTPGVIS